MIFEVKKGTSFRIVSTVYLDADTILADLTGATFTAMLKKDKTDSDSKALETYTELAGMTALAGSKIETVIQASHTNNLSYPILYFEVLVKLADGNYIRSGTDEIHLKSNIINALI